MLDSSVSAATLIFPFCIAYHLRKKDYNCASSANDTNKIPLPQLFPSKKEQCVHQKCYQY